MVASARERLINERAVQLHRGLQGYLAARDSLESVTELARFFLLAIDGGSALRTLLEIRRAAAEGAEVRHKESCPRCSGIRPDWAGYCAIGERLAKETRELIEAKVSAGTSTQHE